MTCESTVSVCGCVWVSQEPLSCCSLIRDAKHRPPPLPSFSFLLHEPMIPLGRVQNASTVYLLSVPSDPSPSEPHNHRLWHQFSYWQLISPHRREYQPRFHGQILICLAGTRHCCLHTVLQLTMAEILLHCRGRPPTWHRHPFMCQTI